jgi:toxin-antitoxin system PIN domain toxin
MAETLLDVNVLLALAWPNHQHHAAAHEWFRQASRRGWATCALTQLAFVRLSSNPAYTPAAVTPAEAASLLTRLTTHGKHRYWDVLAAPDEGMFVRAAGHQQVMDAYLVREAERHRGRLATFDRRTAAHATNAGTVQILEG